MGQSTTTKHRRNMEDRHLRTLWLALERSRRIGLAALVMALLSAAVLPAAQYKVEVEQGGVARWDGENVTSCGMDGKTYQPVDSACWYAIDFERNPGVIEIARWTQGGGIDKGWLKIVPREFETQEIEFPDDRYVHLSAEDLANHYQQQARLKPRLGRGWSAPAKFSIPLAAPADSLPQGGGFGAKRLFNGEPKNAHTGTDYAIPAGTPVKAVADGDVVLAEEHFFAGLGVYVDHGNGLFSMSFHLQKADAEEGAQVTRGAKVGEVGSTGRSTGPHLHLGIRWRGARIDPEWLINKSQSVPRVQAEE